MSNQVQEIADATKAGLETLALQLTEKYGLTPESALAEICIVAFVIKRMHRDEQVRRMLLRIGQTL